MSLIVGFEKDTAGEVKIDPTHILTGGTTGAGKSVLERALISRVTTHLPFKIVLVDLKQPPDYAPFFPNIPVYVNQTIDATTLLKILETKNKTPLKFQFPELIKICQKHDTWEEIYDEMCDLLDNQHKKGRKPLHPVRADKLLVLRQYMGEFMKEMEEIDFAKKVHIDHPVQVMKLTGITVGLQQLIIRSVSEYIMKNCRNTILLIDEFHRVAPNGMVEGGAKDQIRTHIKEGRALGNFLWASNQTLTSTDPEVRKNFQIWILGRQNDINEAKRVVDQTVEDIGINFKDVYRMKQGFFLLNDFNNSRTKVVYAWPDGVTREAAIEVALGRLNVEKVAAKLNEKLVQTNIMESGDEVWKERFDELSAQYKQMQREKVEAEAKYSRDIIDLQTKVTRLSAALDEANKQRPRAITVADVPAGTTDMVIDAPDLVMQVNHREALPREFDTGNVKGQIMYIFSEQTTRPLSDVRLSTGQIKKQAEEYGWNSDLSTWSKRTSELVKEGSLVQEGDGNASVYRLPTKVEFISKMISNEPPDSVGPAI